MLKSISQNLVKPNVICVVSSGINVQYEIKKYTRQLAIKHFHTKKIGQITQREIGINYLKNSVDFIIFLDDDVILKKDFFKNLYSIFANLKEDVYGVGFKNLSALKISPKFQFIQKIFLEWSAIPGQVLLSGVTTEYGTSSKRHKVSWLNGLSAWRARTFFEFNHIKLPGKYAALEDLHFSFKVGQRYKLMYFPSPKLKFQDIHSNFNNFYERTLISNYNRYYFVKNIMKVNLVYYIINLTGKILWQIILIIIRNNKKTNFKILAGNIVTPFFILIQNNKI